MSLPGPELARLLCALTLLLTASHGLGYLFRRLRQPPVIGEILGGLLLGPTVFGAIAPAWQARVFAAGTPSASVIGAVYEMGLLLLMFCSGAEMRSSFTRGERRTVLWLTGAGTLLPFGAGAMIFGYIDPADIAGPAGNETSLLLIVATAVAVTSIPVISRIFADLKVLGTDFARIVLSVAVIEDVILYAVVAVALATARPASGNFPDLPGLLGMASTGRLGLAYHAAATLSFLGAALSLGPAFFRRLAGLRLNLLQRANPVAHQLTFLAASAGAAVFIGIPPMFGAFAAGVAVGASGEGAREARASIQDFSFAFFIPVYFAVVGLKLNLLNSFDPGHCAVFIIFACVVKTLSAYAGARLSGETSWTSWNLAVALNARGGPCIVLASLAFDAGVINGGFYATLVLLAVLTSFAAGTWLDGALRKGLPLRENPA